MVVMADKVMQFLVASGGGSLDEILVRVSARPETVVQSLIQLADKGYVRVTGPKDINDFNDLVLKVRGRNGYELYSKFDQKKKVVEEIVRQEPEFMKTIVSPTARGLTFGL
jgi:hypothetical protein